MCSGKETPYDILGISPTDSLDVLKARYKELARHNHPDKLHGLPEVERKEREEYFKKVTVAYHTVWAHKSQNENESETEYKEDRPEFIKQWQRIYENMSKVTDWTTIFKNTLHDVASMLKRHTIQVPVRLIEIHEYRKKKVRIFLRDVEEPIFIDVDCARFPYGFTTAYVDNRGLHHSIRIELFVDEKDAERWLGDDNHVHENIYISWSQYIHGFEQSLTSFNGEQTVISIPPFAGDDYEIRMTGWGVLGRDWIIHILCKSPTKEEWISQRFQLLGQA
jgi:DnaJ-class molecular chaperone